MNITDESYERAKAAIAGLKAAGGWDLTGFEHLWADVVPELTVSAMLDGEIWVSVDGNWLSVGVARSLTIEHEIDQIDVTHMNGLRSFAAGLQQTKLRVEIAFTNEAWTWLLRHGHEKFDIRVGAHGHVIETQAALENSTAEISHGMTTITVEAAIIGPQTVHNP